MARKIKDIKKSQPEAEDLKTKYNRLISEIRPKLLTNAQLKQGGSVNRAKYEKEKGYATVLNEINFYGKQLGYPRIGLGSLRA